MAIAFVQDSTITTGSGTPCSAAVSISPSAGNALIVTVTKITTLTQSIASVSDNIDGTTGWALAVEYFPSTSTNYRGASIWYKANVPSGVTTVTVTGASVNVFDAMATEFSGLGTTITVQSTDTHSDSTVNSFTCSTAGLTYGSECLSVGAGALNGTSTECNPGGSYTEMPASQADAQRIRMYQLFASGCTNDTGPWSSTGTARSGRSCMALFSGNAAAGGFFSRYYYERPGGVNV